MALISLGGEGIGQTKAVMKGLSPGTSVWVDLTAGQIYDLFGQ